MGQIYEVTVQKGEDIKTVISDYILKMGWDEVYISGAIGSVIDTAFTAPIENTLPLKAGVTPCPNAAEILSFTGEVMKREKMDPALAAVYPDKTSPLFVHIHASCATAGGHVIGGGLNKGKAFRSVRVFMTPIGQQ